MNSVSGPSSFGIVDHDPLALYALRDLARKSAEGVRVLWTAPSCAVALRCLTAVDPEPDVVLVDERTSHASTAFAPLLKRASRDRIAVVMMSSSRAEDGAPAPVALPDEEVPGDCVPKEALARGCGAIRSIVESAEDVAGGVRAPAPSMRLSDKEHRVIDLYARGMTARSVARRLSVSQSTVKTYARRAYEKLGVGTRAEAVAILARQGDI